jgi:PPOX class probable F420-dependent enzyme
MSDDEVTAYLAEQRTMNVGSFNHDNTIHLVAMWYALDGDTPVFWTYGKSQKIRNLERDPRITCLVESGDRYEELKGVELVGRAELVSSRDAVMRTGELIFERYFGTVDDTTRPALEQMGAKRHVARIHPERVVSWDHTKLGGVY